jgi:hypothetical protein
LGYFVKKLYLSSSFLVIGIYVGQTSLDRTLNFAFINIFQAASTFDQAIAQRRQLDTIKVEKSPFCRRDSDY